MTAWILAEFSENLTNQISALLVEYPQNKRYTSLSILINTIVPLFLNHCLSQRRCHVKIPANNNDCCILHKKF